MTGPDFSSQVPSLPRQPGVLPFLGRKTTGAKGDGNRTTEIVLLFLLLCAAAFLRFARLEQNGLGNLYYAAAVRSMLESPAHFFYAAYDPAGFLSVDKPPLALWVQTLSARWFGYHGLSLLIPQGIVGLCTLLILYSGIRRTFGPVAALIAAGACTILPISVATERLNLPDPLLTLFLTAAGYWLLRAVETGRIRFLLLCAAFIGMGFNIKLWEAALVAPITALVYYRYAALPHVQKLAQLSLAGVIWLVTSLWWLLLVDATPPAQRPYVGGSRNNTVTQLVFGYNGWERVVGGASQFAPHRVEQSPEFAALKASPGFSAGQPGLFRFLGKPLATQLLWWLPLMMMCFLEGGKRRRNIPVLSATALTKGQRATIFWWGGFFLSFGIVFSVAGGTMHPYYVSVMAPAVAGLTGIGVWWLTKQIAEENRENRILAAGSLLAAALFQAALLLPFPGAGILPWIAITVAGNATVGVSLPNRRLRHSSFVLCLVGLCVGPGQWALTAVQVPGNGLVPSTGPEVLAGGWQYPAPEPPLPFLKKLAQYLALNYQGERFILATGSVYNASPLIVRTGKPVMAMGGFLGSDPILTPQTLAWQVQSRQVRFLLYSSGDGLPGNTYLPSLFEWANQHCRAVHPDAWKEVSPGYGIETMVLFDCQ